MGGWAGGFGGFGLIIAPLIDGLLKHAVAAVHPSTSACASSHPPHGTAALCPPRCARPAGLGQADLPRAGSPGPGGRDAGGATRGSAAGGRTPAGAAGFSRESWPAGQLGGLGVLQLLAQYSLKVLGSESL